MFKKIKNKQGGTHIIEILICIPVIIVFIFYPISLWQMSQQMNYIEDVKTAMVQEMSRDGDLTETEITNKWIPLYEKMKGIKVKKIDAIEGKILRDSDVIMNSDIIIDIEPSLFSFLLGGEYKTKAMIYSEYVND